MSKATDEYGFVELARTFHELSMKPGESDDYAIRTPWILPFGAKVI